MHWNICRIVCLLQDWYDNYLTLLAKLFCQLLHIVFPVAFHGLTCLMLCVIWWCIWLFSFAKIEVEILSIVDFAPWYSRLLPTEAPLAKFAVATRATKTPQSSTSVGSGLNLEPWTLNHESWSIDNFIIEGGAWLPTPPSDLPSGVFN